MNSTQAARFECYATKRLFEDRPVFTWPNDQWKNFSGTHGQLVLMDVSATPMSGVAADAAVLACVAEDYTSPDGRISIYRYDAADGSTPINKDTYRVLRGETLRNTPNLRELAIACGTCADTNLYRFLDENDFIVKEEPGDDHWLSELPEAGQILICREE